MCVISLLARAQEQIKRFEIEHHHNARITGCVFHTANGIYTLPIPEQQRTTVEKLSVLMANDGKLDQKSGETAARLAADSMR
jgi:hypothetical protein